MRLLGQGIPEGEKQEQRMPVGLVQGKEVHKSGPDVLNSQEEDCMLVCQSEIDRPLPL